MRQLNLILNLSGLDPSGIYVFTKSIISKTTTSTALPNSVAVLPRLITANDALHLAIIAPIPNRADIQAKIRKVKRLLILLKATTENECNDDEVIALSSGFELKAPSLPKPKVFDAKQGALTGTVHLVAPYAGSHCAYKWEITPDPIGSSAWQELKTTNNASCDADGLTAGNKYWFRVRAIVNDEYQDYTDPHMVHVV
jgi:hypothetical protein